MRMNNINYINIEEECKRERERERESERVVGGRGCDKSYYECHVKQYG